jgi:hypothetical protein
MVRKLVFCAVDSIGLKIRLQYSHQIKLFWILTYLTNLDISSTLSVAVFIIWKKKSE